MKITFKDYNETTELVALLDKIENIDAGYVNDTSDSILNINHFS